MRLTFSVPVAGRAVALACVVALCGVVAGPAEAWGSPSPSTTAAPPTSTTSAAKTTTTTTPNNPSGVPKVPVGGPPTTTVPPKKGAQPGPPPPPPNPGPILTAVHTDLSQLQAISDYQQARTTVAAKQRGVNAAELVFFFDQKALDQARASDQKAEEVAQTAAQRLQQLAIAAYIGLGYTTPAAGPQTLPGGFVGTVSTPGGLTATQANEAEVMLRLVGDQERADVVNSEHQVKLAGKVTARAEKILQGAAHLVTGAQAALVSSQRNLSMITEAATTPGLAATMAIPGPLDGAGSDASPTGSSTTTGSPAATQLPGAVNAAVSLPASPSPSILGPAAMTGPELAAWFASTGHKANTTVPMPQLAAAYQAAGTATGVRDDLAFAQSIVETGYFSFPSYGQLTANDNNFAGIGACDSCATGWKFPTAADGVGAQLELLESYASTKPVKTPLLPGNVSVGGCCQTWVQLAGVWASSLIYGISIMTVYNQMLTWVIPKRLVAAGLEKPPPAAAAPAPKGSGAGR
jgi:Mannosyl-glycoprotein endo-beta-N-acetylglucosaminidase